MLDWITLTLEAMGLLILCAWAVVPIREFRVILRRVRLRNGAATIGEATVQSTEKRRDP